jgi:phosphatidylserine/phosphatidylglycerophosphate/cardiolipin synthase-like enzyme
VLTENFKPSGTGGRSNRGWGAVVHDAETASTLAAIFEADAGWRDSRPWEQYRANRTFHEGEAANGSYPTRLRPRRLRAERVRVVAAPDNAEGVLLETIRGAEQSVLVQQVSVGGRRQPFLRATLAAARRGVRVRLLLSSAWYVEDDNRRVVEWLNGVAAREGLPLRARLAEPRSRYGTVHAKGVVVDGDTAVVGSLNWNNHSARENREVAVVLEGEAVGRYYARAFRADWRGGTRRLPAGVVAVIGLAAACSLGAIRAVTFERR